MNSYNLEPNDQVVIINFRFHAASRKCYNPCPCLFNLSMGGEIFSCSNRRPVLLPHERKTVHLMVRHIDEDADEDANQQFPWPVLNHHQFSNHACKSDEYSSSTSSREECDMNLPNQLPMADSLMQLQNEMHPRCVQLTELSHEVFKSTLDGTLPL